MQTQAQHLTGTITTADGLRLFTQAWLPPGAPRAVVLLAHGVGEHSSRYSHVAAYLAARGYALYALDHRGHGQSDGERVVIRRFDDYVDDLRVYFEQVRGQQPDRPVFLYGHSMGSIIALRFALRYQDALAGLIVTGTALRLPVNLPQPVLALAELLAEVAGSAPVAPSIELSGLSHDPQVAAAYAADPLIYHGRLRLKWSVEMLHASREVEARLPELRLPLLALHGADDPIALPAGAEIVRDRAGSGDLTVRQYPGLRHEIHNEPEQGQVLDDIAAWLDAHVGPDPS